MGDVALLRKYAGRLLGGTILCGGMPQVFIGRRGVGKSLLVDSLVSGGYKRLEAGVLGWRGSLLDMFGVSDLGEIPSGVGVVVDIEYGVHGSVVLCELFGLLWECYGAKVNVKVFISDVEFYGLGSGVGRFRGSERWLSWGEGVVLEAVLEKLGLVGCDVHAGNVKVFDGYFRGMEGYAAEWCGKRFSMWGAVLGRCLNAKGSFTLASVLAFFDGLDGKDLSNFLRFGSLSAADVEVRYLTEEDLVLLGNFRGLKFPVSVLSVSGGLEGYRSLIDAGVLSVRLGKMEFEMPDLWRFYIGAGRKGGIVRSRVKDVV